MSFVWYAGATRPHRCASCRHELDVVHTTTGARYQCPECLRVARIRQAIRRNQAA